MKGFKNYKKDGRGVVAGTKGWRCMRNLPVYGLGVSFFFYSFHIFYYLNNFLVAGFGFEKKREEQVIKKGKKVS